MIPLLVAVLSAVDCQPCHAQQFVEWQSSRHSVSFRNAVFAASYAREPMRWCLTCHAPLPEQIAAVGHARRVDEVSAPLVNEGVNCVACHFQNGKPVSSRELAAPEFCGRCHQFNFPGTDEPMQDTVAEWHRSGAGETCQDCHMPEGAHTFPGAHNLDFLKSSVTASVTATATGALIKLRTLRAAHRVPTGDPFRRFFVELCDDASCDEPLASPSFGRLFTRVDEGWRLQLDAAIPPGASEVVREVKLPHAPAYWRLMYGYAAGSSAPSLTGDDWAVELDRGRLNAAPLAAALPH